MPRGFCLTTARLRTGGTARARRPRRRTRRDRGPERRGRGRQASSNWAPVAGRARRLIEESPIPHEVDAAVRKTYEEMGGSVPVAVRSSATAEDLPFASFAGQQDSYLDVTGADAVVEAVRRCWASLWSERAVAYRSANGISNRDVGLAVVVQVMVDAATAGVLFTANPVTGKRTETVINASPGSGQAVVSGAVNPDQFVLETASGLVTRRYAGRNGTRAESKPERPPAPGTHRAGGRRPAPLRGAAGHRMGHRRRRQDLAHPVTPDHHAVSAARARTRRRSSRRRGPDPGVPVRHPVPGADPADHPAGADRPRDDAQQQGTLAVRQPRAADVRGPDGRGPQQVRPRLSAADAPPGGRQVRGRASGAAGGPKVRRHRALVPGNPSARPGEGAAPATAPAHRGAAPSRRPASASSWGSFRPCSGPPSGPPLSFAGR